MQSLGHPSPSQQPGPATQGSRRPGGFRVGALGLSVLVLAFLVAVIFAANQNDVIGWVVAVISLGWLAFAVFVFLTVRGAGRRAQARFEEAARQFGGRAPKMSGGSAGEARTVDDARDLKLDHSFKIIQVQERVVRDNLGKDADQVARALETIQITAANARDMLRPDPEGPVTGTLVDEG
ncbi:MARVEL domain-containing protein [Sinomonas mesophila]|uniref:MARVEL domain-containing protein n=1 Tax=Sinomonas mesophila TaxID=1531955 RepID=UPI0009852445|nr:MARVEL domain-containing protein [Sinomonas mesophila]